MSTFELDDLRASVEAMLFVTDDVVEPQVLARVLECSVEEVQEALLALEEDCSSRKSGITLRKTAGGYRLFTHPAYHDLIERYVVSWDTRKLSQAALETLAIVAYYQPCTRNTINSIRGVNSESVISSLIEKGLIEETGKETTGSNASIFGTTQAFLQKFGLSSKKDLPSLEDFAPDEESAALIRERLSINKTTVQPNFVDSLFPQNEDEEGSEEEVDESQFSDEVPSIID
jgi:segregation and condensation protein B